MGFSLQGNWRVIQIVASRNTEIFTLFSTGFNLNTEIPL